MPPCNEVVVRAGDGPSARGSPRFREGIVFSMSRRFTDLSAASAMRTADRPSGVKKAHMRRASSGRSESRRNAGTDAEASRMRSAPRRHRRRSRDLQKTVAIGPDDTLGSLYFNQLFPLGVEAMLEAADLVVVFRVAGWNC